MRWRLCVEAVWTDWLTGWVSLFGDFEYFAVALTHSLSLAARSFSGETPRGQFFRCFR